MNKENAMPEWLEKEKEKVKRELESSFLKTANRCGIAWDEPHSLILDDTANYCFLKCYELMSEHEPMMRAFDLLTKETKRILEEKEKIENLTKPRPISEAPKDKKIMIFHIFKNQIEQCRIGKINKADLKVSFGPTHWLPMSAINLEENK